MGDVEDRLPAAIIEPEREHMRLEVRIEAQLVPTVGAAPPVDAHSQWTARAP